MPEQLEKIYIDRVPEEHYETISTTSMGSAGELVTFAMRNSMTQDFQKEAENSGRVFADKDRYFLRGFNPNNGLIGLASGTYADFNIARELLWAAKEKGRENTYRQIFDHTTINVLGLQNLLTTSDGHWIIGKRGQKVFQAPGALCLPAGGVMPDLYGGLQEKDIDVYLASLNQMQNELGFQVPQDQLSLTSLIRDNNMSPNTSLIFEADLPYDQQQATDAFNESARDRWEHDGLLFLEREKTLDQLAEGKFTTSNVNFGYPIIGASLGAIINQGRRLRDEDWLASAKQGIRSFGYEIVYDQ